MSKKIIIIAKVKDVSIYDPDEFEVVEKKKPNKGKKVIICFDCAKFEGCSIYGRGELIHECGWFDNKRCGNCDLHSSHDSHNKGTCLRSHLSTCYADYQYPVWMQDCQWKPIVEPAPETEPIKDRLETLEYTEPVCEECKGRELIDSCYYCETPIAEKCPNTNHGYHRFHKCPSCQGPEEEGELMVPVGWSSAGIIDGVYQWWLGVKELGMVCTKKPSITNPYEAFVYGKYISVHETFNQAKLAVGKALGFKGGGGRKDDKYKISKESISIRSNLNREHSIDTLAVNINNEKLTDKEFREFVSNSVLG